jgi:DNA excision repair protein ERCC-3
MSERELGRARLELAREGWPVVDARVAPRVLALDIRWRSGVELRPYQRDALRAFRIANGGVVLLPCGAGKTLVGVGAIVDVGGPTLVLTPSTAIGEQWRRTLLEMTTISEDDVVIWRRGTKPRAVTIATYHAASGGSMRAMLESHEWALAIYDEAQALPAATFRHVSAISAPRRLGLSATLVREDAREAEVFAMAGPIIYDVPWIELESQGWIAPAACFEVRIPAARTPTEQARYKAAVVERLLAGHPDDPTLLVGSNVASLQALARRFELPLLVGSSDAATREATYQAFRERQITRLAISRIGSVGLDLPSAKVMIQINGNFGSRQEEAQRLGRLLRPDAGQTARFYTLVSLGTSEEAYARKRQRFLIDQGYQYQIIEAGELPRPASQAT